MEALLILPGFIVAIITMVIYEIEFRKLKSRRTLKNKVHFYVARDKSTNKIWLYIGKPIRNKSCKCWFPSYYEICDDYNFGRIGLDKNNYKDLKWKDEPVEVFLNLVD